MKSIKKKIALLLAIVMLFASMPNILSASAEEFVLSDDIISEHVFGDYIYNYDFSSFTNKVGEVPQEWDFSFRYPGINYNAASVETAVPRIDWSCLFWTPAASTDHIVTLPELGTENYMVTMVASTNTGKTSFGLVTGIPNDYKNTQSAVYSYVNIGSSNTAFDHTFTMRQRKLYGTTGQDGKVNEIPTSMAQNYITEYNSTTDLVEPVDFKLYDKVTLSITHVNGVNRFYVNGLLVSEMEDVGTNTGLLDRIGIYLSSYATSPKIKIHSISAREIIPCYAGEQLLYEDFSNEAIDSTELPNGWTNHYYEGINWDNKVENQTALTTKIGEDADGKYLEITNAPADQAITLPALGTEDYVFTARLKGSNTFGILTDILNDYANTQNYTASVIYANNNYFKVITKQKNSSDGVVKTSTYLNNELVKTY